MAQKNKPYITKCSEINFNLSTKDLLELEVLRRKFYDQFRGYTLSLQALQEKSWSAALNMEHDWGHSLSERLCDCMIQICDKKNIAQLYALPNICKEREESISQVEHSYRDYYNPPLACTFPPTSGALYKIDDYEFSFLGTSASFLIFPKELSFLILVSWEKNCQIIAGPKETVEYLISGDCKESWQILSEDWAYTDPDRNYSDLRQFAHDLGYFNGKI
jgi:hypothetical protein